jgi:hypothetical protein
MRIYYMWCTPGAGIVNVSLERNLPLHAVILARSTSAAKLRNLMRVTCRKMWSDSYAVPGMPEAGRIQRGALGTLVIIEEPTEQQVLAAQLEALNAFGAWLRSRNDEGVQVPDHYYQTPVASWDPPPEGANNGAAQAANNEVSASKRVH